MSKNVNFRWDEEFIARIDGARGLVPRSAFVRQAIELKLATLSTAALIEGQMTLKVDARNRAVVVTGKGDKAPEVVSGRLVSPRGYVAPIPKGNKK